MGAMTSKQKFSFSQVAEYFIFVPDSGTQKALSGPLVLSRYTCNLEGGTIIMVPIFQMRKLRLSDLIKVTLLST